MVRSLPEEALEGDQSSGYWGKDCWAEGEAGHSLGRQLCARAMPETEPEVVTRVAIAFVLTKFTV